MRHSRRCIRPYLGEFPGAKVSNVGGEEAAVRVALMVNRRSRSGASTGEEAVAALTASRVTVESSKNSDACDAVVAVGGDGTLLRAIAEALRCDVPLGIIPAGTFNELARTLGIPFAVPDACAIVAARHTRAIDVAVVNDVYYVNEASIGISSRAARLQTERVKRRFGFLGIVATTMQALRYSRPMFAEISFDSQVVVAKTVQLTVANSNRFGGIVSVPDAAIDDGWLDLYSVESSGFWGAFAIARAILSGKRDQHPGLRTYRSKQFTVRQHRGHHIVADGEPAGKTPATFRVLPKALRVFVPQ